MRVRNIRRDREAGAAYVYFVEEWPLTDRRKIRTIEISRNVLLDVAPNGSILGIELLAPDWAALDKLEES